MTHAAGERAGGERHARGDAWCAAARRSRAGASVSTIEKPHGDHAPVTPAAAAATISTASST